MNHGHRAVLGAVVVAFALLFFAEGAALPTAWLPVEEAAVLVHARGDGGAAQSTGVVYPALLAPAARALSPTGAHRFAKGLAAALLALTAIPAYLLARRLVGPNASLVAAALAVVAPGAVYATAAVPDALALLLAVSSLPLLARASERGDGRQLAIALSLAGVAALTRPWFVVLPPALLVAYELPRSSPGSFLRWPRSSAFAGLAAFGYLVLAATAPDVGSTFSAPGSIGRAAAASLVVAVLGAGIVPWLLAARGARPLAARPETALLATCLPALALAAGVFGATRPGLGVEERPLLVLVPLVLALAASAWVGRVAVGLASVAPPAALVVLGALALPSLGRAPTDHAAGLSVVAPNGGSRAFLFVVVLVAVGVALAALVTVRDRPFVIPAALALFLVVGHATAWTSVRGEARALAATEPTPRDWVDRHAGSGAHVFIVGTAADLDARSVAQLTLWNRSVRGVRALDPTKVDVPSGTLPTPGMDVALVRGDALVGSTEIARSVAGVLVRPPLGVPETIEGLFSDGWSGDHAYYRRFSGPARPGVVIVTVSRVGWGGKDRPGEVRVDSSALDGTNATQQADVMIHAGEEKTLEIPVPAPPFRISMTVQPTFSPSEFGGTDTRQLGAQITFKYRP